MQKLTKLSAFVSALCMASGMTGCGNGFTHLDMQSTTAPPPNSFARFDGIQLEVGRALAVTARPMKENEPMDEETVVELRTEAFDIIGADPGLTEGVWIFYGASIGTTSIRVIVDDDVEARIPAAVVEPQEP